MGQTLLSVAAIIAMAIYARAVDPCKSERDTPFSSQVQVEFGMAHDEGLTEDEMENLQDAFVDAYNSRAVVNEFNQVNCDIDLVRRIDSCEVEALDSYFLFENGNKVYRRVFTFDCKAQCRLCDQDQSLLDNTPETRRELQSMFYEDGEEIERELLFVPPEDAGGFCTCHEDAEIRGPSQQEMKDALKVEISNKKEQNQLHAVKSVFHVVQMEQVPCSADEDDFDTVVVVKLSGDPAPLDKYAMANGLLDSFNEASIGYCDAYHRRITGVTVKDTGSRRRLRRKKTGGKRKWRLRISGRCRGCPRKARLFDDLIARRLNGTEETTDENSWTDSCYCPKYPLARRPVNESEFKPLYSRSVEQTNDVRVNSVDEVG